MTNLSEFREQDLIVFYRKLADKESLGEPQNGYGAINSGKFLGKYQMGAPAMEDAGYYIRSAEEKTVKRNLWNGKWLGINGAKNVGTFLGNRPAQEDAIRRFHSVVWGRRRAFYKKYIGLELGEGVNRVKVTRLGLLAGSHLVGEGPVIDFLESLGQVIGADGNGTKVTEYMKLMAGPPEDLELSPEDSPFNIEQRKFQSIIPIPKPTSTIPLSAYKNINRHAKKQMKQYIDSRLHHLTISLRQEMQYMIDERVQNGLGNFSPLFSRGITNKSRGQIGKEMWQMLAKGLRNM